MVSDLNQLKLVMVGDPMLRSKAQPVSDLSDAKQLSEQMIAFLRQLKGAGLAAPQIGSSLRVMIVEVCKTDLFPDRPESPLYVLINPEVLSAGSDSEIQWEGCFSVPGLLGLVPRYTSITIKYFSADGLEKKETFEGYLARVVQHEIDHLNGRLYLDRMDSMKSLTTHENYRKFVQGQL